MSAEPTSILMSHREVAKLCGVTPRRLRYWAERGQWPTPHSIVEQTWFYRRDMIEHYLNTGKWPEWVRFRSGVGAGYYQTSKDEYRPPKVDLGKPTGRSKARTSERLEAPSPEPAEEGRALGNGRRRGESNGAAGKA